MGIITVYGLYIPETTMVVKAAEKNLPKLGHNHTYSTRNRNKPAIQTHSLEYHNKKPGSIGIKFLYNIPQNLQSVTDLNLFKKHLKNYLTIKALYSLEEFFEQ